MEITPFINAAEINFPAIPASISKNFSKSTKVDIGFSHSIQCGLTPAGMRQLSLAHKLPVTIIFSNLWYVQISLRNHRIYLKKPGTGEINTSIERVYRDSEDIEGDLKTQFKDGMAFLLRNIRKTQQGQPFNSLGIPEVSEVALEEVLQNAIIHRDYLKNAPIRVFVFDNRIEIISSGKLPNSLTSFFRDCARKKNRLRREKCDV